MQYKCIMCYSTSLLPTDTQLVVVVLYILVHTLSMQYGWGGSLRYRKMDSCMRFNFVELIFHRISIFVDFMFLNSWKLAIVPCISIDV